jgi:hypothetical protein
MDQYPRSGSGCFYYGLTVLMPVECTVIKAYVFNNRFMCVRGRKFFKNGLIKFPDPRPDGVGVPCDPNMRYKYGYDFSNRGVVYKLSNHNICLAATRLTNSREPELPGEDVILRVNQQTFCCVNGGNIIRSIKECLGTIQWGPDMRGMALDLTFLPHKKMRLRAQAYQDGLNSGDCGADVWLRKGRCNWQMKPGETAKNDKITRNIVDEGVYASLQTVPYATVVKAHMADRIVRFGDTYAVYCGVPSPEHIARYFDAMLTSTYRRFLVFSSDDSVLTTFADGIRAHYNLDFKTNDASHTDALVHLNFEFWDVPRDIRTAVIGQMYGDANVRSVDKRHCCTLRPLEAYMPSGMGDTTIRNNGSQFFTAYALQLSDAIDRDGIMSAGRTCGFSYTIQPCEIMEDIQLLKFSPMLNSTGSVTACINAGVILSCSGTSKAEINRIDGSIEKGSLNFQSNLMKGVLSGIDYPPFSKLDPGYIHHNVDVSGLVGALDMNGGNLGVVKQRYFRDDFYRRYRLTDYEITELEEHIAQMGFGMRSTCMAAFKIIEKDYERGLRPLS